MMDYVQRNVDYPNCPRQVTFEVHPGEPDEGGYWGRVVELPGCYSQGETLPELYANLQEALEDLLEWYAEDGVAPPFQPAPAPPATPAP